MEQHDFPFAVTYTAAEFLALIGTELDGTVTKPYNCLLVLATVHPDDE